MFIKPKVKDQIVRHPDTQRKLKAEGEKVADTTYWRRRVKDGSVVVVSKTAEKPNTRGESSHLPLESKKKKDGGK